MTCVVALKHEGHLYFGGERYAGFGGTVYLNDRPKVWKQGAYLFGASGTVVVNNLVQYKFTPPAPPDIMLDENLDNFMMAEFAGALLAFMNEHDLMREDEEEDAGKILSFGGSILVGVRGRLYLADNGCGIFPILGNYAAIGAARDLALGVLYGLEHAELIWTVRDHVNAPREDLAARMVKLALAATVRWTTYTREPFDIITDQEG